MINYIEVYHGSVQSRTVVAEQVKKLLTGRPPRKAQLHRLDRSIILLMVNGFAGTGVRILDVFNPATGAVVDHVRSATPADVDAAARRPEGN